MSESLDIGEEAQLENLMNIVVEARKRFRNACIEYQNKMLLMETKILNSQVGILAGCPIRNRKPIPDDDVEVSMKDLNDLMMEILRKQSRMQIRMGELRDTNAVVRQLDSDYVGRQLRAPLNADAMLAQAQAKNAQT